jgi:hypothetical protein
LGVAAVYLFLFQPFWPASRASALLLLAAVLFITAIVLRKKTFVRRALVVGIPAAVAAGVWLIWLSSLPANTVAPNEDVAPLFADPQTHDDVVAAFSDNGTLALSVEQVEQIRSSKK